MSDILLPRRKFLTGLFGIVAAPAIVKAANIMPVKVVTTSELYTFPHRVWVPPSSGVSLVQIREMLMPGYSKWSMAYTEHPERWKSLFERV